MTAADIIAAADIPNVGWGLQYLLDSAAIPTANTYTDGYQLTLTWTWSKTGQSPLPDDQCSNVCVQYLDSDDTPMPSTDTAAGAPWLCLIAIAASSGTNGSLAEALAMKTQTHAAYLCYDGTSTCGGSLGGGTVLPTGAAATNATTGTSAILSAAASSTYKWFQPSATSDYNSALRRYGAGDKVRGWQVVGGSGKDKDATITNSMLTKDTNVRTLAGAAALATGVALGAAALAF